MIHLYPELSTLYHRALAVSLSPIDNMTFMDEFSAQLRRFIPDKTLMSQSPRGDWTSCTLGQRNRDTQRFIAYPCTLQELIDKPPLADLGDSLFIEVDPLSPDGEQFFKLLPNANLKSKKLVFCFRNEFSVDPNVHELALDKKLREIAPNGLRILWPNDQFLRDALEWVLSF